MKEHKHAEVLRALADGVPLSEFEVKNTSNAVAKWEPLIGRITKLIYSPEYWQIRRKPQYIMVNGFKVPKPLDGAEKIERAYTPALMDNQMSVCWYEPPNIATAVSRGIAHATKEAAIAHAKAMLGLNPKWEEG